MWTGRLRVWTPFFRCDAFLRRRVMFCHWSSAASVITLPSDHLSPIFKSGRLIQLLVAASHIHRNPAVKVFPKCTVHIPYRRLQWRLCLEFNNECSTRNDRQTISSSMQYVESFPLSRAAIFFQVCPGYVATDMTQHKGNLTLHYMTYITYITWFT